MPKALSRVEGMEYWNAGMVEGKTQSGQCTAYGPRQKTTFGESGRWQCQTTLRDPYQLTPPHPAVAKPCRVGLSGV